MSETSKPEAWQRRVHIGLHHDIHFLRYAQRQVFADVPVRLGNRTYRAGGIQRVTFSYIDTYGAVRKPHLPEVIHLLHYVKHVWGIGEVDAFCMFFEFIWNAV